VKHTRLLALLTAVLLLIAPMAQATSHIAYFQKPEGAQEYTLEEMPNAVAPEGLEGLYALFAQGNPYASVYVFRMPGGQALMSISCLEMAEEGSTEALYYQADALAQSLKTVLGDTLTAAPVFTLEEMYGQQVLTAPVTLLLPGESDTRLQAEARATIFYRGKDLIEVWTAYPAEANYLFDQEAAAALESDLAALAAFEATLDFSLPEDETGSTDSLQSFLEELEGNQLTISEPKEDPHMTVTADDGTFRMDVPLDTLVLHASSDETALARGRALFADIKGGEECFELWLKEIQEVKGWLLISREYGVAAQVYVTDAGSFAGMSAENLLLLETPVLENMKTLYDNAQISEEGSVVELDGMEHAWFSYSLDKGDMHLLTFVMAAADDIHLYEVDIYSLLTEDTDEDEAVRTVLMMLNSLDYLPEMGV